MNKSIWIGFDPRESQAYAVARQSANRLSITPIPIYGLDLRDLVREGYYTRPVEVRDGKLWDPVSEFWMSTEFANSRFLVPQLARARFAVNGRTDRKAGWALFTDCDVLYRVDPMRLFDLVDSKYAVMCVQHDFRPLAERKMDGQVQSIYGRKNWSSVMLINCDHPSHEALWTKDLTNTLPGRDLHRFCWLKDEEIGSLPIEYNYLVGHYTKDDCDAPAIVHFTDGIPTMPGYEATEYADEWRDELHAWVRNGH